jgi:hypothetical protein
MTGGVSVTLEDRSMVPTKSLSDVGSILPSRPDDTAAGHS